MEFENWHRCVKSDPRACVCVQPRAKNCSEIGGQDLARAYFFAAAVVVVDVVEAAERKPLNPTQTVCSDHMLSRLLNNICSREPSLGFVPGRRTGKCKCG